MLKAIFAAALMAGPLACFPLIEQAAAEEGQRVKPVLVEECGGCHMAYHPIFLPARSWPRWWRLRTISAQKAELDEATTKHIAEYLTANAGDRGYFQGWAAQGLSASDTPSRTTQAPWWLRIHEKHNRDPVLQRAHAKPGATAAPATRAKKGGSSEGDR